jgi:hypothetical protein
MVCGDSSGAGSGGVEVARSPAQPPGATRRPRPPRAVCSAPSGSQRRRGVSSGRATRRAPPTTPATRTGRATLARTANGVGKSILQNIACPSYPIFDGSHLYWVENVTNIGRADPDGSNAVLFAQANYLVNMVQDDKAIYWLELGGSVWKKAK